MRGGGDTLRRGAVALLHGARTSFDRRAAAAIVAALLLLVASLRAGWLSEDAFITLRTVDNWVNGYGLRWNVAERVQSYTHPLWMLLVAGVYWLRPDPATALVLPSLAASAAFLALLVRSALDWRTAATAILLLGASKAFVEFSCSGLENPLAHVLLGAYVVAATYTIQSGKRLWLVFAVLALLLVTRLDLLWLVAPSLVLASWCARAELASPRPWLALAPLIAWEVFSLVYYGFAVPNTAYAKLSTGVAFEEVVAQGLRYMKACLVYDPVTLPCVGLGLVLAAVSRQRAAMAFAAGLLLWLVYLVRVGGDFMIGRLLTPALVVAALLIATTLTRALRPLAPWAAAIVLATLALPRTPLWGAPRNTDRRWLPERVTDERALAYPTNGLFQTTTPGGPEGHPWVQAVKREVADGRRVTSLRSIGIVGYFAGPQLHIVDEYGLCDPLLARLPAEAAWSPGHFLRKVPPGYLETLESGHNQLRDPLLARRYDELRTIVRGPLFSLERLRTILRWNLSRPSVTPVDYDVRVVDAATLSAAPRGGQPVRRRGVVAPGGQGLKVVFEPPVTLAGATIAVDAGDRYVALFRRGERVLWRTWLEPNQGVSGQLADVDVTTSAPLEIDSILIRGSEGDHAYHIGRVTVHAPGEVARD